MRRRFSFKLPNRCVCSVGPVRNDDSGYLYRSVRVTDSAHIWSNERSLITDPRKLRRAYRRAWNSWAPAYLNGTRR